MAGVVISAVTNADPAVLTVADTLGMDGRVLRVVPVAYGVSIGMDALSYNLYAVTVVDATHLSIPVDATSFPAYASDQAELDTVVSRPSGGQLYSTLDAGLDTIGGF